MNILHHKSWHVRTKKNIERVRRDEQKARDEEEAKEKRKLVAESEARISLLRTKARSTNPSRGPDATLNQLTAILEDQEPSSVGADRRNNDHEVESKKEKEEWEKKMGILTYLGQGLSDPEVERPWYLQDHVKRMKLEQDNRFDQMTSASTSSTSKIDSLKNDPLVDMQRYLDIIKQSKLKKEANQASPINPVKTKPIERPIKEEEQKELRKSSKKKKKRDKKVKKSKHRKLKKHKHEKSKHSSKSDKDSESSKSSESSEDDVMVNKKKTDLEVLRAERLRREKAERERTYRLLNKSVIKTENTIEVDDRRRTYNSQFNPHLAKQNDQR